MELTGSVEEIRFANELNGYQILVLNTGTEMVIAVGSFPPVNKGELLTLYGDYTFHAKFGRQFNASGLKKVTPDNADMMKKYLASGLIRGIGKKTAEAIVNKFGLNALSIIENQPEKLKNIKGFSKNKALEASKTLVRHRKVQDGIMYLQGLNLSLKTAMKIQKRYGEATIDVVSQNPYCLIEDIDGIGFVTADRIALEAGIKRDSAYRLRAGIIYTLTKTAEKSGNTFLYREQLENDAKRILGVNADVSDQLNELIVEGKLRIADIGGEAVFLHDYYTTEKNAAERLVIISKNASVITEDIEEEISAFERIHNIQFNDQQKAAISKALHSGICVITGGPGTGKTTIIRCLLNLFESRGMSAVLLAPTGRAAKRMSESTLREASTIHRAILGNKEGEGYLKQLEYDCVIVDEGSMIDSFLLNSLLKCMRDTTRLIILGDKDQLPSVGPGNVLSDLMRKVPCAGLTKIYRQAAESHIITNAYSVNIGAMPNLKAKSKDFFFLPRESAVDIAYTVTELVEKRLPKYLEIEPERIQVLCPMKNGEAGTLSLNRRLADRLNPNRRKNTNFYGEVTSLAGFKEGDKVMHVANNYQLRWTRGSESGEGVFNGDIGFITSIDYKTNETEVLFEDGRRVVYTDNVDELVLSYAITVHKSQGSEFDAVVIPIVPGSTVILTRNLLYTAITRAKKLVALVGEEYNIRRMVENNFIAMRNSGLKFFIDDAERAYNRLFSIK